MKQKAFIWISALLLVAVAAGGLVAFRLSSSSIKATAKADLASFAKVAVSRYMDKLLPEEALKAIEKESGTRATLIGPDGSVLADSTYDPSTMENHYNRPEVQEALKSGEGSSVRYSDTAMEEMLYYAVSLDNGDILRLSVPLYSVKDAARSDTLLITAMTVALGVVGTAASYAISSGITSKVDRLASISAKYAEGDFAKRMPEGGSGAEAKLSRSFNTMAEALSRTITDLTRQKAELSGVLSSIGDGIIFVDDKLRLVMMNEPAVKLTGLKSPALYGRHLLESMRAPKLEQALKTAMAESRAVSFEDTNLDETLMLAVTATPVRLEDGSITGAVASIRDVSGPRKLEAMKSEFVANVTHELKTPLTSIKGFAQTLMDEDDLKTRAKFLGVIESEADRMSKLVDDIMALSGIEALGAGEGRADLKKEVEAALEMIGPIASEKGIQVSVEAEEGLIIEADPSIIRRLVVNLVDNAVKYNDAGCKVKVRASRKEGSIVLEVEDDGTGISYEDQKRVFERFYRVDKSRSRELGGTGLGLAIVKHIARSLKGEATVSSSPGAGSTFTVTIPSSPCKL